MILNQKQSAFAAKAQIILFGVLAITFVVLAIFGLIYEYSPIPYYDMWDAYVGIYAQLEAYGLETFFKQHNEHRIVISKLLFYLDITYFYGKSYLLFFIQYMLYVFSVFIFWKFTNGMLRYDRIWITLSATCMLFFWSQAENFTWAFQSQFVLAQVLPLTAFYFVWKSLCFSEHGNLNFGLALLCGALSVGTMANGILTLPLLCIYCLCMRAPFWKTAVFAIGAALLIFVYFFDYDSPQIHGSPIENVLQNPVQTLLYIGIYFGSPLYYFFPERVGIPHSIVAGFAVLIVAIYLAIGHLLNRKDGRCLALVGFMAYLGISACGVAAGRVIFGLESGAASRYTTPALFFLVSLVILLFNSLPEKYVKCRVVLRGGLFLACFSMLFVQIGVFKNHSENKFQKRVSALALAYQIADYQTIRHIYPFPEHVINTSHYPAKLPISIFALPEYLFVKEELGQTIDLSKGGSNRSVELEPISIVESRAVRVRLLVNGLRPIDDGLYLRVTDGEGRVTGRLLVDEAASSAEQTAYEGYIFVGNRPPFAQLVDADGSVVGSFVTTPILYEIADYTGDHSVSEVEIIRNDGWDGMDFFKSEMDGIRVLGTFIKSDANMGELDVKLQRGDTILYRSGPSNGGQTLKIPGYAPISLPESLEWVALTFNGDMLDDTFVATFVDDKTTLGQWSAIGVAD